MSLLDEKNLKGKVLVLGVPDETLVLHNIVFETINDKLFITGTIPTGQTNNDWAEGLKGGVAFDYVSNYMIFDSIDDYKNASDSYMIAN